MVTEYEHVDGVLVRSVTRREPEFCEDDVELLLEWQRRENMRGPHGHPVDESQSPLADPMNRHGTHTYRAEAVVDFAEKARAEAAEAWREAKNPAHGVSFRVLKVDR